MEVIKEKPAVVGYFEEDVHTKSSMRMMCFVSLLVAIVFGFITLLKLSGTAGGQIGLSMTISFLVAAFAPKAIQKFAENIPK